MTNRERLLRILDGRPVDRVPIWLLFPYHTLPYYVDVRSNPRYRPVFERSTELAIMLNRRNPPVSLYPLVRTQTDHLHQPGARITRQRWRYNDVDLYADVIEHENGTRVKKLLETDEDLRKLSALPVDTDPRSIERQLDDWLPRYLAEKSEFPEQFGAMMLDLGEPIGPLYHVSNLESLSIWSLTQNELIVNLLDRYMEHKRLVYAYCLERDLADVYFMVGSELAAPPMVSRSTFQQWIVRYGKELVDLVHSHGRKVIMHFHGQIREILPDFVTMGPDGLHTIEAPPVGNCTIDEAFSLVGDVMTLIGNIQYDCFRSYSPREMEEEVRRVIAEARGRRFIISPTAGPFDEDISEGVVQNYLAFLEAAWREGEL